MKRLLTLFAFYMLIGNSYSQCNSCTISISGTDAADHSVGIGQVLCIQPGGKASGRLYISSGGKLCNQGTINSPNVYVSGGGEIDNYGVANMDTLYIQNPSAVMNNYDTMRFNEFGAGPDVVITNNGWIHSGSYGDTAVTFINNGYLGIDSNIYIGPNSSFTNTGTCRVGLNLYTGASNMISNSGSLIIGLNMYIDTLDRFINTRALVVMGEFGNNAGANFTTSCMVIVQGNWYNTGTIDGPATGCGGFRVAGQSYNAGIVGDTGHIDICDAGHPTGGLDGNSGTLTGVTFCQCMDTCAIVPLGLDQSDQEMNFSVFPNPASDVVQMQCVREINGLITLSNIIGEIIQRLTMSGKNISINTSALGTGLYILTVESNGTKYLHKVEIVR